MLSKINNNNKTWRGNLMRGGGDNCYYELDNKTLVTEVATKMLFILFDGWLMCAQKRKT